MVLHGTLLNTMHDAPVHGTCRYTLDHESDCRQSMELELTASEHLQFCSFLFSEPKIKHSSSTVHGLHTRKTMQGVF